MNNSLLLALAFSFIFRRDVRHDRRRLVKDLEALLATMVNSNLIKQSDARTILELVAVESRETSHDRGGELLPVLALLGSGQTSAALPAATTTIPAATTTTPGIDPTFLIMLMLLSQNSC